MMTMSSSAILQSAKKTTIPKQALKTAILFARVFEKLGFERVETVPDAFELPDGQKEDRLIYRKYLTEG